MEFSLCVPTLNRYDLLALLVQSAERSRLMPTRYFIIDNGGGLVFRDEKVHVIHPGRNVGVAASWNWFLNNVPGIKIICNDDIVFELNALGKMLDSYDPNSMITPEIMLSNAFSCFILGENVFSSVGNFDEKISPSYAYFEDNDYYRRMTLLGFEIKSVPGAIVEHSGSSTIKSYTQQQRDAHNRKFELARSNYERKWGGLPGHEKRTVPVEL